MTVRKTLLHAVAAASLFGLTGAAYAAGVGANADVNTGVTPGVHAGAGVGGANAGAAANEQTPPQSIVGQDVKDQSGDKIGEVSSISGNQVIVKTEQSLGIGAREIAVPWSDFQQQANAEGSGSSNNALQLSMTKQELKALPAWNGNANMNEQNNGTGGSENTNGGASTPNSSD